MHVEFFIDECMRMNLNGTKEVNVELNMDNEII